MSKSQFFDFSAGPDAQDDVTFIVPVTSKQIGERLLADAKRYSSPLQIPPNQMKTLLEGVGFNELSVKRLMEVNPRIALMAAESKLLYDNDPNHAIKDRQGKVIGHKTFQVQHNGGYRTVRDQQGPTSAGNSNANASKYQSNHQWGEAVDFWVYERDSKGRETPQPDGKNGNQDFQNVAWYFTKIGERDYGLKSQLQGSSARDDEMRIMLNGSPDWGHIELPERFRDEWHRNPKTGLVVMNGETMPGTWIDPSLHPNAGPTYKPKPNGRVREGGGRAP